MNPLHVTINSANYKTLLSILCPIITLIPVLNYLWATPAEAAITLGFWLASNLLVLSVLWLIAHMERTTGRLHAKDVR